MAIADGIESVNSQTGHNGHTKAVHQAALKESYEAIYEPIRQELAQVESLLRNELVSRDPAVNELLQHGLRLGGKRLRPALVLLAAKTAGRIKQDHILIAAVLEMIHLATLVHDDVLDDATMRRHQKSLNARAGNQTSVLVGDFLFSHAFYLASTLGSTFACQRIGRTTNIVCEGEMRQIHGRGDLEMDEKRYLEIIDAKTAELCACCCELGAHYADADQVIVQQFRDYGRKLGIAFQIVDDLLDLVGTEDEMGKSLGSDMRQEKLTLPLIHLHASSEPYEWLDLRRSIAKDADDWHDQFTASLLASGSLDFAEQRARRFAEQARNCLDDLPASSARDALVAISKFVVDRKH